MMRKVLTIGTFDVPHLGHAYLLKECDRYGAVWVGVNSDEFVQGYKGEPPLYPYRERAKLISLLGYSVLMNDSPGYELIKAVKPDVLVIGSDWARRDYHEQIGVTVDMLDEWGITLIYVPRVPKISSTELKARVR